MIHFIAILVVSMWSGPDSQLCLYLWFRCILVHRIYVDDVFIPYIVFTWSI